MRAVCTLYSCIVVAGLGVAPSSAPYESADLLFVLPAIFGRFCRIRTYYFLLVKEALWPDELRSVVGVQGIEPCYSAYKTDALTVRRYAVIVGYWA